MIRTTRLLGLAAVLLLPVAYASPVEFKASGVFESGQTLSGFINIDTATGLALSGDLKVSGIPADFVTLDLQRVWPPSPSTPFLYEIEFENGQATNNLLTFLFPPDSLIGYTGGVLCGSSPAVCQGPFQGQTLTFLSNYSTLSGGFTSNFFDLKSGSLSDVPEPGTATTTLIAVALLIFWRYDRRQPVGDR